MCQGSTEPSSSSSGVWAVCICVGMREFECVPVPRPPCDFRHCNTATTLTRAPFSFLPLTWEEGDTLSGGLMFLQAPQFMGLSDPFQLYLAAAPKLAAAPRVAGRFTPWRMRS